MPLKRGPNSIRYNVTELVTKPVLSQARKKALVTIARKNGISIEQAKLKQALAISKSQARK